MRDNATFLISRRCDNVNFGGRPLGLSLLYKIPKNADFDRGAHDGPAYACQRVGRAEMNDIQLPRAGQLESARNSPPVDVLRERDLGGERLIPDGLAFLRSRH